jgi:hypothetical protein
MTKPFEDRKRLTFEQAEGAAPLPTQLKLQEVSQELRALLWEVFHVSMSRCLIWSPRGRPVLAAHWRLIMQSKHVTRDHRMADEFDEAFEGLVAQAKRIFVAGNYVELLGFIQWVMRSGTCPPNIPHDVEVAFRTSCAAYTVLDGDTIVPIGSEVERETLERAFADVASTEFNGARAHLRKAGEELTAGHCAESIRESIHAVESVARVLEPTARTLDPALGKLEKVIKVHPALGAGFGKLYGFTSDEKGIRHALLDEPVAAVDETDALYMLGSCASFVSYLINKARTAGLLTK